MLIPVVEKMYLKFSINKLRKQMIYAGIKNGLVNEETIKISQKLDTYITKYQSLIMRH